MQEHPPQHHRFEDTRIPRHITYAYARDTTIVSNDDFYEMPEGNTKTIDLLFLMANAPVATQSLPESGSEPYVGLTKAMKLAMEELCRKFPEYFAAEGEPETPCTRSHATRTTYLIGCPLMISPLAVIRMFYNCWVDAIVSFC